MQRAFPLVIVLGIVGGGMLPTSVVENRYFYHIMRAVMRFSSRIVVLDAGQTIADGTPEETMRQSAVEKAYLGT